MRNKGIRMLLRLFCCLAAGLLLLFLVLLAVLLFQGKGFSQAWDLAFSEGLLPLLTAGSRDGVYLEVCRAVPAALLSLAAALAWQAGLYNLGLAGQYALGAGAAVLCLNNGLPWPVALAFSALLGCLGGALPGWMKARLRVHEALSTALISWLGLYAAQAMAQGAALQENAWPDLSLACLEIGGALAVLACLYVALTGSGFEMRILGNSEAVARYAGIQTEKTAALALSLSGLLCGAAGGLHILQGGLAALPGLEAAFTGLGLQGLAAAMLGGGQMEMSLLWGLLISHVSQGAQTLSAALFPPETGEAALALVLYLAALPLLPIFRRRKGEEEK